VEGATELKLSPGTVRTLHGGSRGLPAARFCGKGALTAHTSGFSDSVYVPLAGGEDFDDEYARMAQHVEELQGMTEIDGEDL